MATEKKIELWEGYEVTVNEQLMDDFDFITDLTKAQKDKDLGMIVEMYFALIGGVQTYEDTRKHIEKEKGYFSQAELLKIISKVDDAFPKAGNRAQRRSWSSSN